jgi:hypothetical protein
LEIIFQVASLAIPTASLNKEVLKPLVMKLGIHKASLLAPHPVLHLALYYYSKSPERKSHILDHY